jgi:putative ATP-dependent endonuclease of OLD family
MRSARSVLSADPEKLAEFSKAASEVEKIAKQLAVPVSKDGAFRPQIDTSSVSLQVGGLALHDGDIPLRQLGLGSRRVLTLGIQQHGQKTPFVSLIDELELGLEPHRVARTVQYLSQQETGQSILTTHSPVVLRELDVEQLFVVRRTSDGVKVIPAAVEGMRDAIQGKIRKGAEAFLSEKIIVCEGATEVGFCRALDRHWQAGGKEPMSFVGATTLDAGGGSNVKPTALAA